MNQPLWTGEIFLRYEYETREKEWIMFHALAPAPAGETVFSVWIPMNVIRCVIEAPPKAGEDLTLTVRTIQYDGPETEHVIPAQLTEKFVRTMCEALVIAKRYQPLEVHGYLCLRRKILGAPLELAYTQRTVPEPQAPCIFPNRFG
ncbi:MAG TPA: hypothetical protein VN397_03555 [Candidatus Methylomirabilis sp.]|nr:hypothetical protein [Candidatus Methylomirabilis sp.]